MQNATRSNPTKTRTQPIFSEFLLAGVLVWLEATVVIRLWGHKFFIPESNLSMGGTFLFSLLFLPLLVYALFRWKQIPPHQCSTAAICLAAPGLLLDVVFVYFFRQFFPNMPATADGAVGSCLLWGYALVLVTGLVMSQGKSQET